MRPKKRILLVDADGHELSVRQYLLETRGGYEVHASESPAEALMWLRLWVDLGKRPFDLLVCSLHLPGMGADGLVEQAKRVQDGLPALVFAVRAVAPALYLSLGSEVFLPAGFTAAELLENVRVLATRKRGPKPRRAAVDVAAVVA